MKKHIMLIDDDRDELAIFVETLNQSGISYKCTWAQSGSQALQQLRYLVPDLVFLDINMPGLNGFDTLKHIRQLPTASGLPVILYSTGLGGAEQAKGFALGATHCFKKPATIEALAEELKVLGHLSPAQV